MLSIKTVKMVGEIARKYEATLVAGNAHRGKDRMASNARKNLGHRTHQCYVGKLVEVLNNKPLYVVKISEAYSSSRDPFSWEPIKSHAPYLIRVALRGGRG